MDLNPLLFAVQRVREEADQRRILERALAESSPLERLAQSGRDRSGDRGTMRSLPVVAKGVGGTMPGTDPLRAVLRGEQRRRERRAGRSRSAECADPNK